MTWLFRSYKAKPSHTLSFSKNDNWCWIFSRHIWTNTFRMTSKQEFLYSMRSMKTDKAHSASFQALSQALLEGLLALSNSNKFFSWDAIFIFLLLLEVSVYYVIVLLFEVQKSFRMLSKAFLRCFCSQFPLNVTHQIFAIDS